MYLISREKKHLNINVFKVDFTVGLLFGNIMIQLVLGAKC